MTPLVVVHGFMGGAAQWRLQAPLGQDRELILIDLPGFGANAGMPALSRIADFADWVLADVSARGITRFDLMGHSMGGMIVQEMTHRAPQRINKLILYGTGPVGAMPGRFEPITTSMQRARDDGAEATARRLAAKWFVNGAASPEYPACADLAAQSTLPAILGGLQAMQGWSGAENLAGIDAPTLVLWGDQDRAYPWAQVCQLWQGIQGSALAVLPDCGHSVHSDAADLFNEVVQRFLSR